MERQIETHTYQRLLSTQATPDSEPATLPAKPSIRDFIKDPYVLDDNPTIGLILCTDNDETIVQYSVLKCSEQLFASKYRTLLPTEAELIAELEHERRVIERKQNGGDILAPEP